MHLLFCLCLSLVLLDGLDGTCLIDFSLISYFPTIVQIQDLSLSPSRPLFTILYIGHLSRKSMCRSNTINNARHFYIQRFILLLNIYLVPCNPGEAKFLLFYVRRSDFPTCLPSVFFFAFFRSFFSVILIF